MGLRSGADARGRGYRVRGRSPSTRGGSPGVVAPNAGAASKGRGPQRTTSAESREGLDVPSSGRSSLSVSRPPGRTPMKAADPMTRNVATCRPDQTAADAARVMWDRDCGVVPVVDRDGSLKGVVTDRDLL